MAIKRDRPYRLYKDGFLNSAEAYKLKERAIAPGYKADLVVVDNLEDFNILKVFKEGQLVAEDNKPLFNIRDRDNNSMKNTVNIKS